MNVMSCFPSGDIVGAAVAKTTRSLMLPENMVLLFQASLQLLVFLAVVLVSCSVTCLLLAAKLQSKARNNRKNPNLNS